MKKLSVLFVGLLSAVLIFSVIGVADVESSVVTGELSLEDLFFINASTATAPSYDISQSELDTYSTTEDSITTLFNDPTITVDVTSLSTYTLYSAYQIDSDDFGLSPTGNLLYLRLDSTNHMLKNLSFTIDDGSPSTLEEDTGSMTPIKTTNTSNLEMETQYTPRLGINVREFLDNISTANYSTSSSATFEIGFFIETPTTSG